MQFRNWLEAYEDWSGRWIHYSHGVPRSPDRDAPKVPVMKINYKMMWNDPFGIYFFPEKFESETQGNWHNYEFKWIVEFPKDMKVFDMAKFTDEEFDDILVKNSIQPVEAYKHLERLKPSDRFWATLEDRFKDRKTGSALKAKMNKFFRSMGYDAIFDDTDAIYKGETQLILLNPGVKYKVLDIKRRSTTGWDELTRVLEKVVEICNKFGKVTMKRDFKTYSGWDSGYVLKARVAVNEDLYEKGPYIAWELRTGGFDKKVPTGIDICLSGATPRLQKLFSYSQCERVEMRSMDMSKMEAMVARINQEVWDAKQHSDQTAIG